MNQYEKITTLISTVICQDTVLPAEQLSCNSLFVKTPFSIRATSLQLIICQNAVLPSEQLSCNSLFVKTPFSIRATSLQLIICQNAVLPSEQLSCNSLFFPPISLPKRWLSKRNSCFPLFALMIKTPSMTSLNVTLVTKMVPPHTQSHVGSYHSPI